MENGKMEAQEITLAKRVRVTYEIEIEGTTWEDRSDEEIRCAIYEALDIGIGEAMMDTEPEIDREEY